MQIILSNDAEIYKEFKGAIAENFALLELLSIKNGDIPYYWTSGNKAEVDFVWQLKDKIIPIEVKAGESIGSRSLILYRQKYKPEIALKLSMKNLYVQDGIMNIPLYFIWNLEQLV